MNSSFRIQKANIFVEERAKKINDDLNNVFKMMQNVKSENESLKRMYDLSVIHLIQIQNDIEMNHSILNKLREKVEKMKSITHNYQENIENSTNYSKRIEENEEPQIINMEWNIEPNISTVKLKFSMKINGIICSISFQENGENIAFCNGKTAFLVSSKNGELIQSFEIPNPNGIIDYTPRSIKFSPDSQFLAIGGPNNTVIIYSLIHKKIIANFEGHHKQISALLFSNDSLTLYSGGYDGLICIWDISKLCLKQIIRSQTNPIGEMIISLSKDSDEYFIAAGLLNGVVGVYDPLFQQPMNAFQAHDNSSCILDVSVSPFDGTLATSANDKTIKIWGIHGVASCRKTLHDHTDLVLSICFSPKQTLCFTGSKDETIKGWDYKKGDLLFTIKGHKNTLFEIAHHPFEKAFASCSGDGVVCVWEYDL